MSMHFDTMKLLIECLQLCTAQRVVCSTKKQVEHIIVCVWLKIKVKNSILNKKLIFMIENLF